MSGTAVQAPHIPSRFLAVVQLLRPHQWIKNILLFVPLLLSHRPEDPGRLPHAVLGFVVFCLCASAGYVINDLHDRESDRSHPLKRRRPLASGTVSTGLAWPLAIGLLAIAFALSAWRLPTSFTVWAAVYVAVTLLYSLWLKSRLLVDVFLLAGLYSLRLLAGGAAVEIELTEWLLAFSMFLFLSLAFAKRYAELAQAASDEAEHLKSRNYRQEDMAIIATVGPTSGYLAVLVLAIYINSDLARQLYQRPLLLWLVCPMLLYWITRVWFIARRRGLHADPIIFALTDRVSWVVGALVALLMILAAGWAVGP